MGCNPEKERWVWLSFDPKNKIILAAHLGDMTQKSSDEIIKQTSQVINENNLPLFVTDGRKFYKHSLLKKYSEKIQPHPIIKNGRLQKPSLEPFEELKYAQVVKTVNNGKLENVKKKDYFWKKKKKLTIQTFQQH
ncbi:MAG: hypothetical protein LBD05_01240 [Mycoplasmataceae bacterium]|jgi:hypothetical protein|nr:hypothetical protein [Mycoplasmataceae bacterium]